jgi:hypothetical protein
MHNNDSNFPKPVARLLSYKGRETYPKHGYTVARTYNELPENHYPELWEEGAKLYTEQPELAAENALLRLELNAALARAARAEAKVAGWEATVVCAGLPQRVVPAQGWGPEGGEVSVPAITPQKLTDLLDRLATLEGGGANPDTARMDFIERTFCHIADANGIIAAQGITWVPNDSGYSLRAKIDREMAWRVGG